MKSHITVLPKLYIRLQAMLESTLHFASLEN